MIISYFLKNDLIYCVIKTHRKPILNSYSCKNIRQEIQIKVYSDRKELVI